jgi:hypothetical protein
VGLRGALATLGGLLPGAALAFGSVRLLASHAIFARIDEGFAAFG